MRINKLTFNIEDEEISTLFTAYLQRIVIKWIPFHICFWAMPTISFLIFLEFDAKIVPMSANLLISLIAFFVTKRHP